MNRAREKPGRRKDLSGERGASTKKTEVGKYSRLGEGGGGGQTFLGGEGTHRKVQLENL